MIFSEKGISLDPDQFRSILELAKPTNKKEVKKIGRYAKLPK